MTHWSAPFIGLPYRDHGRDRAGVDCWGLAVLVFREVLGIELPSYAEGYVSTNERAEIADLISQRQQVGPWFQVEEAREYDALFFRRGPHSSHVGVVVRPGMMLHCPFDHVKIEPYDSGLWKTRLTGIYRHVELSSKEVR